MKRMWLCAVLLGCGAVSSSVPDATPDPAVDAGVDVDAEVDAGPDAPDASTACVLGSSKLDQCTL